MRMRDDLTAPAAAIAARFRAVRERSLSIAAPLSAEDCCVQSMTDASPVKWHLAHTTWFFETFILERHAPDFAPYDPAYRYLFNSYYEHIGARQPRPQRGMLTRPSLDQVLAYRAQVDARLQELLRRETGAGLMPLLELGIQHEQQHQELMLTDLKHLLSLNPIRPAYCDRPLARQAVAAPLAWQPFSGGVVEIGYAGNGFCFDNELPRHRQYLEPYALASRLVTNGEFLAFIEAGGYRDPACWLSEAWEWVGGNRLAHPLYWQQTPNGWQEFTLHGMQALDPLRPATHLSYFEADAYARWAGARLPTEAEWEAAVAGAHADAGAAADGRLHPEADPRAGLSQLFGACWQWTSSSYAPYPGFSIADGAIGEYNGKFMVNQYVLRGSSCATPPAHARASYRNFFAAHARWQFAGIRLARSGP
jgi:ergothioneine biosynthesis protein EgtB